MPLIKIGPRETIVDRVSKELLELTRFDTGDQHGQFASERSKHRAKLEYLRREAESHSMEWDQVHYQAAMELEIYDSGKDDHD